MEKFFNPLFEIHSLDIYTRTRREFDLATEQIYGIVTPLFNRELESRTYSPYECGYKLIDNKYIRLNSEESSKYPNYLNYKNKTILVDIVDYFRINRINLFDQLKFLYGADKLDSYLHRVLEENIPNLYMIVEGSKDYITYKKDMELIKSNIKKIKEDIKLYESRIENLSIICNDWVKLKKECTSFIDESLLYSLKSEVTELYYTNEFNKETLYKIYNKIRNAWYIVRSEQIRDTLYHFLINLRLILNKVEELESLGALRLQSLKSAYNYDRLELIKYKEKLEFDLRRLETFVQSITIMKPFNTARR